MDNQGRLAVAGRNGRKRVTSVYHEGGAADGRAVGEPWDNAHVLREPHGVAGREDGVHVALLQPGVIKGVGGGLHKKLKVGLPVLQVAQLVGFRRAHYSRRSTDIFHVYLPVLRIKIAGSP